MVDSNTPMAGRAQSQGNTRLSTTAARSVERDYLSALSRWFEATAASQALMGFSLKSKGNDHASGLSLLAFIKLYLRRRRWQCASTAATCMSVGSGMWLTGLDTPDTTPAPRAIFQPASYCMLGVIISPLPREWQKLCMLLNRFHLYVYVSARAHARTYTHVAVSLYHTFILRPFCR